MRSVPVFNPERRHPRALMYRDQHAIQNLLTDQRSIRSNSPAHRAGNLRIELRKRPVGPTIRRHFRTDCTSFTISQSPATTPNNITMYGGGRYLRTVGPSGLLPVVFAEDLARWARLFEWMDLWSGRSKKRVRTPPTSRPMRRPFKSLNQLGYSSGPKVHSFN